MCPISDSDFLFTSRFSWQQRVQHRVSEVRVKGKQECVVVAVQRGFIVLGTVSITRQAQQLSSGKVNATVWAQRDGDLGICPRGGKKSYALCTHTHKTHTNINICTFLQILKWCIFHKPVHSSFIQPWWIFNEKIKERGGGGVALLHHLNDVIPWHNHNTGPMNTTYWHDNCADMCTFCQCALLSPSLWLAFGCVPSDLVHRRVPKQEHLHCRACVCLNLQNQLLRGFQERHSKQFK